MSENRSEVADQSAAAFYRKKIQKESKDLFHTTREEVAAFKRNLGNVKIDSKQYPEAFKARQDRLIKEHREKLAKKKNGGNQNTQQESPTQGGSPTDGGVTYRPSVSTSAKLGK